MFRSRGGAPQHRFPAYQVEPGSDHDRTAEQRRDTRQHLPDGEVEDHAPHQRRVLERRHHGNRRIPERLGDEVLPDGACQAETQPILARMRSDITELCNAALDGRLATSTVDWDPRAVVGVVLAAGGYPDQVRKGDVIRGLDAAAKLPGKVFHAATALAEASDKGQAAPMLTIPVR